MKSLSTIYLVAHVVYSREPIRWSTTNSSLLAFFVWCLFLCFEVVGFSRFAFRRVSRPSSIIHHPSSIIHHPSSIIARSEVGSIDGIIRDRRPLTVRDNAVGRLSACQLNYAAVLCRLTPSDAVLRRLTPSYDELVVRQRGFRSN
jgi:hypothetical protein